MDKAPVTDPVRAVGRSRVEFYPLGFRKDRTDWIVGRFDTGRMIALPEEGVLAIELLQEGFTLQDAARRIEQDLGRRVALEPFVGTLATAGMVAAVDGTPVSADSPIAATLPGLRPEHVRWALSRRLHCLVALVVLAGLSVAALEPRLRPSWNDLLWSGRGSLVIFAEAALSWLLLLVHELAHLVTARAGGVPGRIRFGTRLQFLVVQTEVSGVWLCDRRTRITVYLSGMATGLAIASCGLLVEAATGPSPLPAVVVVIVAASVAYEFLAFMRTDVYFLLQDLLGCRNLYGDASALCRHVLRRSLGRRSSDPLGALGPTERRRVRGYALFMLLGTVATLAFGYLAYTRVTLVLLVRAVHEISTAPDWLTAADAAGTLAVLLSTHVLWGWAWWRRHGPGVRDAARHAMTVLMRKPPRRRAPHA